VSIDVVIATLRRPDALRRCLHAVITQERMPDQVIVVARLGDLETRAVLDAFGDGVRCVEVERQGVVAALEAGIAASTAAVIAFTDDDAVPRLDWLRRIEDRFATSPDVGGVGGRDWCWFGGYLVDGAQTDVGRVQWFGRTTGGHHVGVGQPRSVDVLKGVNMAFRRRVLREVGFDRRLRGDGAQVHFELALGLGAKRLGWRLVYDPAIAVDHYPAHRVGEDQRESPSPIAIVDATHNETMVILEHLPPYGRLAFGIWGFGIGTRSTPGLVAGLRLAAHGLPVAGPLLHTQRGRIEGWRSYRRSLSRLAGGQHLCMP
jgi:GT2 family glycosyltransferase